LCFIFAFFRICLITNTSHAINLTFAELGYQAWQINLEEPNVHHDALEFPDGQVVKLTRLCEGQHATVLQLPASPRAMNEAERQKRGSLVA
jgi:hypothetical protein